MTTLAERLQDLRPGTPPETLLERFTAHATEQGMALYSAQEEAILALLLGSHVVLATPTGSGKSLVALALHARSIVEGTRTYYTAPIKALVSEKFFALSKELGPANVGLQTGDATVNRDAPVICCTAEILASVALREGSRARIASVVMDEFHYYSDKDRGMAWQLPLLTLPDTQFLLMSATLGNVDWLTEDLRRRSPRAVEVVRGMDRPVPLDFEYRETPLKETLGDLLLTDRAPVYVVHFSQRAAHDLAQDLMSIELVSKERKYAIKGALGDFRFDSPYGKDISRFVKHGVGVHHAGLLPRYRRLVERLAQEGLLAVIAGTDTLGVGVNVPIRSVLFTQLCKWDGVKTAVLTARDFQQIAGRAGRRGFDVRGWAVAQAPDHAIENRVSRMKAQGDAKKMKKLVLKKPPERGYAHWDEATFQRLSSGEPERLESRFETHHALVLGATLGAAERGENGCRALSTLIRTSHESRARKFAHGRRAIAIVRALRDAEVFAAEGATTDETIPRDFALHQPLSLFAVSMMARLDTTLETHALDVLSIVEATLEDPAAVLMKQLDVRKTARIQELKAEGVEYDERMAELEKVDIERPLADLLEAELDVYRSRHPWVNPKALRPKSVVRELFEKSASFYEYIRELGLERSEGVLLRYLSDAQKALVQTVPESQRTDELEEIMAWLRTLVRGVDASLLDEWERLSRGQDTSLAPPTAAPIEEAPDVTRDVHGFSVMVKNAVFRVMRALSRKRYDDAAALVRAPEGEPAWDGARVADAFEPYLAEHATLRTDAASRAPSLVTIEKESLVWVVRQTLLDPDETNEWVLVLRVPLAASREAAAPVLELVSVGR